MADACDKPITVLAILDDVEVVAAHVDARAPDLALVDVLLRMRLAFGRHGWEMRLLDVPETLHGLLELVGLADLLLSGRRFEPRGQAELGEQLRIDEVVEPGDPLA
jgi:hypothetical protein